MAAEPAALLDISRGGPVNVIGAVRVEIGKGETIALTGPSGVGKTTLIRMIAGLETRFEGIRKAPEKIAVVFQEPVLLPWRNARQNIEIVAQVSPNSADAWLSDVGLVGLGEHFPSQMSLGQQRRLALARAFAARPQLLLMDEPFVSLDPATADDMMSLFERLRSQHNPTTLLVTHAETEAKRLAGRVLRLEGRPALLV